MSTVSYDRVRRELLSLPGLYQRCEALLVRFPPAFTQRVAGGGSTGLVLDERVTSARRDILAVLASWSGLVADERGLVRRPERSVPELAAFLAVHLDWLLEHPAGSCFAAELRDATAAAATAVGGSGGSGGGPGVELGRCVEDGCDQVMVAALGASASSSSSSSPSSSSSGLEVRCAAGTLGGRGSGWGWPAGERERVRS